MLLGVLLLLCGAVACPDADTSRSLPDTAPGFSDVAAGDDTTALTNDTVEADGGDGTADSGPSGECRRHEDCEDGNPCTTDLCDVSGNCLHPEIGGPCDDGDPCTELDSCEAGVCGGRPVVCEDDDEDPCTAVVCTQERGCVTVCRDTASCVAECASDVDCDDDDPESEERCVVGTCSARCEYSWPPCDDDNPCTDDRPDESGICRNLPLDEAPCDDGSLCTTSDRCVDGVCVGVPLACDDGNSCTADRCRANVGCVFQPLPDGDACEDGNLCTRNDMCLGAVCVGEAFTCPEDDDPCSIAYCDPGSGCQFFCRQSGDCESPPCDRNTDCDDADPCTIDRCEETRCSARCTHAVDPCDDGDFCTLDYCDAADGGCRHDRWCRPCDPAPSEGRPSPEEQCDDGNVCTIDRCLPDGICDENVPLPCPDDGDPCTAEFCEEPDGCQYRCREDCGSPCTMDEDCDDDDACTVDTCLDSACGGVCRSAPRTCRPERECAVALCVAGGCISSVPAALPTLDGVVTSDWHPASLGATESDPSDWEDARLDELRVQVGDNLLYVGIRGFALGPGQAVVGYLDVDLGDPHGLTRPADLQPGEGGLDGALAGCASFGASGFKPDFGFGTVEMASAYGAAGRAGWRVFLSSGALRWMPEGAVVAGQDIEAVVTLDALLPNGVPDEGAAMALVILVTESTSECSYADQSLPNQPTALNGPAPRILAVYRFVAQPSLVECCTTAADCRDDDPCSNDICPPDGRCVHLSNGCDP